MTPAELRQRRQSLGMSQAVLAAALGITENRYQAWETGRNGIPPFLHLALDALDALAPRISSNPYRSRLTEAEARAILAARGARTARSLAIGYQVSIATIYHIWSGTTWPHLQSPQTEE